MACCPKDAGPGETLIKLLVGILIAAPAIVLGLCAAPLVLLMVAFGGRIDVRRLLAWPVRQTQAAAQSVTGLRCSLAGRMHGVSPRLAGLMYRHFLLASALVLAATVFGVAQIVAHLVRGAS